MAFRADPAAYLLRLGQMVVPPSSDQPDLTPDASAIAFVCHATSCPPPTTWRGVLSLRGLAVIPGTAVATFTRERRYCCADGTSNAGLAMGIVLPNPHSDDWIEQAGYLDLLEQARHPVAIPIATAPTELHALRTARGGPGYSVPYSPLQRRRLPFLRGQLRRGGRQFSLMDDADQYCVIELAPRE